MRTLQGRLTDNKQSHADSDADQVLASSPKDVLNSMSSATVERPPVSAHVWRRTAESSRHRQGNARSVVVSLERSVRTYQRIAGDCRNCGSLSVARSRRGAVRCTMEANDDKLKLTQRQANCSINWLLTQEGSAVELLLIHSSISHYRSTTSTGRSKSVRCVVNKERGCRVAIHLAILMFVFRLSEVLYT